MVFRYEPSGRIVSQYEVWGGQDAHLRQNAFIVGEVPESALPLALIDAFESVRLVGQVLDPNRPNAVFYVFYAEKLNKWPLFDIQNGEGVDYE